MKSINEQIGVYLKQLKQSLTDYETVKEQYDAVSEENYKNAKEFNETDWNLVNKEMDLCHKKNVAIKAIVKTTKALAKLTGYTFSSMQQRSMKHGYEYSSKCIALKVQSFAEELKIKVSDMQSEQEQFNH